MSGQVNLINNNRGLISDPKPENTNPGGVKFENLKRADQLHSCRIHRPGRQYKDQEPKTLPQNDPRHFIKGVIHLSINHLQALGCNPTMIRTHDAGR